MKNFKHLSALILTASLWQPAVFAAPDNPLTSLSEATADTATETGTAVQDTSITALVKSKLLADSRTSGLDIKVITENKVVTLTGNVASNAEKSIAEQITLETTGVKAVKNHLVVVKR